MMDDADDRVERLIDRAASALTDVGTSPAFTARVMARLDAPVARRRSRWGPVPAFAAACALLIIAFAGWWPRTDETGGSPTGAQILASRSLPTTSVLVPAISALAAPRRGLTEAGVRVTPQHDYPRVHVFDPISIDQLAIASIDAESAPVAVEPLLAPDPIQLDPVAIDAIELSPLPRSAPPHSPGGRR